MTFLNRQFFEEGDKIGIRTLWAYGPSAELEFVAVKDSMVGPEGSTGFGTIGMTVAEILGTATHYPDVTYTTAGSYNFDDLKDQN